MLFTVLPKHNYCKATSCVFMQPWCCVYPMLWSRVWDSCMKRKCNKVLLQASSKFNCEVSQFWCQSSCCISNWSIQTSYKNITQIRLIYLEGVNCHFQLDPFSASSFWRVTHLWVVLADLSSFNLPGLVNLASWRLMGELKWRVTPSPNCSFASVAMCWHSSTPYRHCPLSQVLQRTV